MGFLLNTIVSHITGTHTHKKKKRKASICVAQDPYVYQSESIHRFAHEALHTMPIAAQCNVLCDTVAEMDCNQSGDTFYPCQSVVALVLHQ